MHIDPEHPRRIQSNALKFPGLPNGKCAQIRSRLFFWKAGFELLRQRYIIFIHHLCADSACFLLPELRQPLLGRALFFSIPNSE